MFVTGRRGHHYLFTLCVFLLDTSACPGLHLTMLQAAGLSASIPQIPPTLPSPMTFILNRFIYLHIGKAVFTKRLTFRKTG